MIDYLFEKLVIEFHTNDGNLDRLIRATNKSTWTTITSNFLYIERSWKSYEVRKKKKVQDEMLQHLKKMWFCCLTLHYIILWARNGWIVIYVKGAFWIKIQNLILYANILKFMNPRLTCFLTKGNRIKFSHIKFEWREKARKRRNGAIFFTQRKDDDVYCWW